MESALRVNAAVAERAALGCSSKSEPACLALPNGGLRVARGAKGWASTTKQTASRASSAGRVAAAPHRPVICMADGSGAPTKPRLSIPPAPGPKPGP